MGSMGSMEELELIQSKDDAHYNLHHNSFKYSRFNHTKYDSWVNQYPKSEIWIIGARTNLLQARWVKIAFII